MSRPCIPKIGRRLQSGSKTLFALFILCAVSGWAPVWAGTAATTPRSVVVTKNPGCPELILNQGPKSWPEAATLMPIVSWGCFSPKNDDVFNPDAVSNPNQSPLLASSAAYRQAVAPWVLLILALFTAVAYVLKLMYWSDIRPPRMLTSIPGALVSGRLLRQWGLRPASEEEIREEGEDPSVERYRRLREHWRNGPERLKTWALFLAILGASFATIFGIAWVEFRPITFH